VEGKSKPAEGKSKPAEGKSKKQWKENPRSLLPRIDIFQWVKATPNDFAILARKIRRSFPRLRGEDVVFTDPSHKSSAYPGRRPSRQMVDPAKRFDRKSLMLAHRFQTPGRETRSLPFRAGATFIRSARTNRELQTVRLSRNCRWRLSR
jgi:hypothetical protein